jgi:hypothetical protein
LRYIKFCWEAETASLDQSFLRRSVQRSGTVRCRTGTQLLPLSSGGPGSASHHFAITPGVVLTGRVKKLMESAKDIEKLAATHLLGLGLSSHIADMAVYLASDESVITTGQVLSVDSGVSIC